MRVFAARLEQALLGFQQRNCAAVLIRFSHEVVVLESLGGTRSEEEEEND